VLAPAIEDEQLMPDQHGFGDNGTESTRPRQSGQSYDQMNDTIAKSRIPANGIKSKNTALRPIWQFAIDTIHEGKLARCIEQPRDQQAFDDAWGA
jgi:hypothetical protein